MKQFGDVTGTRKRETVELTTTYKIMDREVTFRAPGTEQLAYLGSVLGVGNLLTTAGALINFLASLVEDDDARYINSLLLNHRSGFDIQDVEELLVELVEEWGGNPSKPASGSSGTQGTTGKRSTANSRRVSKTPSTSASTAS